MSPAVVIVAIVVVALVAFVVFVATRRRDTDAVSSFQRQIDALSPEARRGVVDQVHRIERGDDQDADRDADDDAAGPDDERTERGS